MRSPNSPLVIRRLIFICLTVAVLLPCISCKSDYPTSAAQLPPGAVGSELRPVKVAVVAQTPVGEVVSVSGALAAQDQATLSVKVPGRLSSLPVDLGSVVRKGDVLATVERKDYELRVQQAEASIGQARARLGLSPTGSDERIVAEETATVRQAKATLEEARANRERSAKLIEQGVVPRAEFDRTDAAFKVALGRYQDGLEEIRNRQAILQQRVSELSLAKQQLADTSIASPFDGVVQERKSSVGEYLAAGAPVLTVVKIDPLRFRGEVPEREAHSVKAGQTVRLTLEGDPTVYTGRIVRLSPTLSEQNRVLMIEAEVRNNGKLRPGAFAKAEIVTSDSSVAVTVPTSSVTTFAGIEKVVVVQNGKAVERPVTTGRRTAEWTEILSGISVGESVIADPGNIQSGQLVKVLN